MGLVYSREHSDEEMARNADAVRHRTKHARRGAAAHAIDEAMCNALWQHVMAHVGVDDAPSVARTCRAWRDHCVAYVAPTQRLLRACDRHRWGKLRYGNDAQRWLRCVPPEHRDYEVCAAQRPVVLAILATGRADVTAQSYCVLRWAVRCGQRDVMRAVLPRALVGVLRAATDDDDDDGDDYDYDKERRAAIVGTTAARVRSADDVRGEDARRLRALCAAYPAMVRSAQILGHVDMLRDLHMCSDVLSTATVPGLTTHGVAAHSTSPHTCRSRTDALKAAMTSRIVLALQRVAAPWRNAAHSPPQASAMTTARVEGLLMSPVWCGARVLCGADVAHERTWQYARRVETRINGNGMQEAYMPVFLRSGPTPCEAALAAGAVDVARRMLAQLSTTTADRRDNDDVEGAILFDRVPVRFFYVTSTVRGVRTWLSAAAVRAAYSLDNVDRACEHWQDLVRDAAMHGHANTLRALCAPQAYGLDDLVSPATLHRRDEHGSTALEVALCHMLMANDLRAARFLCAQSPIDVVAYRARLGDSQMGYRLDRARAYA